MWPATRNSVIHVRNAAKGNPIRLFRGEGTHDHYTLLLSIHRETTSVSPKHSGTFLESPDEYLLLLVVAGNSEFCTYAIDCIALAIAVVADHIASKGRLHQKIRQQARCTRTWQCLLLLTKYRHEGCIESFRLLTVRLYKRLSSYCIHTHADRLTLRMTGKVCLFILDTRRYEIDRIGYQ